MSDESSNTNAHFKHILKSKSLFWHLMPQQVRIQEDFSRGVRFNHITVHTLRIRRNKPDQTVDAAEHCLSLTQQFYKHLQVVKIFDFLKRSSPE